MKHESTFVRFAGKVSEMARKHPRVAMTMGVSMAVAAAVVPSPAQPAVVALLVGKAATAVLPESLRFGKSKASTPERASLLGQFVDRVNEMGKKHPVLVGTMVVAATATALLSPVPTPVHAAVVGLVVRSVTMALTDPERAKESKESKKSLFTRFCSKIASFAKDHPKLTAVTAGMLVATAATVGHDLSGTVSSHLASAMSPPAVHEAMAQTPPVSGHEAIPVSHEAPPIQHEAPPVHHAVAMSHHEAPPVHHEAPPIQHEAPPVHHEAATGPGSAYHHYLTQGGFGMSPNETLLMTQPSSLPLLNHLDPGVLHDLVDHFGEKVTAEMDGSGHTLLHFHAPLPDGSEKVLSIPVDEHGTILADQATNAHITMHDGVPHVEHIPVPEGVHDAFHDLAEDDDVSMGGPSAG